MVAAGRAGMCGGRLVFWGWGEGRPEGGGG